MTDEVKPEVLAIHQWIRDDAPVSMKMTITPKLIAALVDRLDAARNEGRRVVVGEPVAWVSPKQLASHQDGDYETGLYLPVRKTPAGMFRQALYAAAPSPPVADKVGEPVACWCYRCKAAEVASTAPQPVGGVVGMPDERLQRYFPCPTCGNKRCPRSTHHIFACTGSNEPGQLGSTYGVEYMPATPPTGDGKPDRDEPNTTKEA